MSGHPSTICVRCGVSISRDTDSIGSSPVHELLNSNLSPNTDIQMDAALQALQNLENEISAMDEQISQMYDAMQRMQERRSALHDYAAAHKGLVSSFRRFPAEILSKIFLHSLPALHRDMSEVEPPLLLERVCRRWKDISRSTPALWSYIKIHFWEGQEDFDRRIVSTYLTRAGNHPLTISLGSRMAVSSSLNMDHPALALLVAHCERWHAAYLHLSSKVLLQLSEIRGRLPSLHKLHIYTTTEEDDITIVAFADAPMLRYFDTSSSIFLDVVTSKKLLLPWAGLTSLVIDERMVGHIWAILQDCPNLIQLEARIAANDPGSNLPHLILPHLCSLSLRLPKQYKVLSTLTLPSLKHATITITTTYGEDEDMSVAWHVRSGLSAMFSQSNCALLELTLRDDAYIFQSEDLIACLEPSPSLIKLDVTEYISSILPQTFLDYIGHDGAETPLVPQLGALVLDARHESFPWHLLPDFLNSRRVIGDRLEVLRRLRMLVNEAGYPAAGVPDFVQDALCALQLEGMVAEVVNERDLLVDWL
ncbi:hypothetical protein HWV62_39063 [Athelia sp. TMB]|nr:hypothetical protein HWV62_39063 [Athelia sp. TMB]